MIALEKNKNKLQGLKKHCANFNANNVDCFCFDSTMALINDNIERDLSLGPPFLKESFHRILLDGPCSALGQRPQLFNTITLAQLNSHVYLQKKLFFNVSKQNFSQCTKKNYFTVTKKNPFRFKNSISL